MKNVLRLLCGWMAIALAACTNDEFQEVVDMQKPVAQKTISVKAYTPTEQAATRLNFEEGTVELKLSWSEGDAFTAVIGEERVIFMYDTENGEFTADVDENFELSNGTIAYYPAYDDDEFVKDFSIQTGTLNSATTYMEGEYNGDAFSFNHSTAILKASFSGLPQNAMISSIQISGAVDITIANYNSSAAAYINLPAIPKDGQLKFMVETATRDVYIATQTVKNEGGIKTGVFYTASIALTPAACNLPTGSEFNAAISNFLQGKDLTQIKFIANSVNTDNSNQIGSSGAYMVANGKVLEIHTAAPKFVFNADCKNMFDSLGAITAINFGNNIDTSQVTKMSYMFSRCPELTSLDLSGFDTSNATDMSFMFMYCYKLTSLDLSSFNTANVASMSNMFNGCNALTSLDLSNFNTSKVEYMILMFYDCSKLSKLDLSNFNTSKVTSMFKMFKNCFNLTSLDLSSFRLSSSPDLSDVFYDLGRYLLNGAKTQICVISTELAWTADLLTNSKAEYIFPTCNLPTGGVFKSAIAGFLQGKELTQIKFIVNSANVNKTAQIGSSNAYMVANGNVLEVHTAAPKFVFNAECDDMFSGLNTITAIDFGNNVDTSNVTNMYGMFSGCSSLTSLNLSGFNTSNVTTMGDMFYQCNALTTLNVSSFNTSKVTNMSYMFAECHNMAGLDLSSFDFGMVAAFKDMFYLFAKDDPYQVAVYVYVKNGNDKTLLESAETGINSNYAIFMV